MPDKSQHRKGKHPAHSKKSKAKQRYAAMSAQPQVAAQIPKPAAPASMPAPSTTVRTKLAKTGTAKYPYITTELRRIGILAGIMLALLIVLALVLS